MKKLFFVLTAAGLAGCFNYTSIMTIQEDGTGALLVKTETALSEDSEEWSEEEIYEGLDTIPGWRTTLVVVDTVDTIVSARLEGFFDDPLVTAGIFDADILEFTRKEKRTKTRFYFRKEYEKGGKEVREVLPLMEDYDLDAYTWHEELVLPGRIVKHNADEQRGDTLIWERRTWDVFERGLELKAVWEVAH